MKILKSFIFVLMIVFGVLFFIFGGYDDSPGAQGLGAIFAIIGILALVKFWKKSKKSKVKS